MQASESNLSTRMQLRTPRRFSRRYRQAHCNHTSRASPPNPHPVSHPRPGIRLARPLVVSYLILRVLQVRGHVVDVVGRFRPVQYHVRFRARLLYHAALACHSDTTTTLRFAAQHFLGYFACSRLGSRFCDQLFHFKQELQVFTGPCLVGKQSRRVAPRQDCHKRVRGCAQSQHGARAGWWLQWCRRAEPKTPACHNTSSQGLSLSPPHTSTFATHLIAQRRPPPSCSAHKCRQLCRNWPRGASRPLRWAPREGWWLAEEPISAGEAPSPRPPRPRVITYHLQRARRRRAQVPRAWLQHATSPREAAITANYLIT